MRQTASAFSCGGAGASPSGIIHYTDDTTIAATAIIGKRQHIVLRNRTATVRALMQLALPLPGHASRLYTEQQVLRHLISNASNTRSNFWQTGGHCYFSIAILAPISDLSDPERGRSHGDLGTMHEILS